MSNYQAPLRDMKFHTDEVLDFPAHYSGFAQGQEASPDIVTAILESAAQFAEEVLAPLDKVGDEIGCQWHDGEVTTPPGFKAAYAEYIANGWTTLSMPVELGGQGLPASLSGLCMEIMCTANHAWTMYPGLSMGGIQTIAAHADDSLKQLYLPSLIAGQWSATMCLTEAHCGSDLGLLRTRATPSADGSYRITGSKIFISSGEHDLTDNIVHIVLARLPDAPPGIKGISLFLVPKFMVTESGKVGSRNTVRCGSIEHKMGIHGNATCVINFDDAVGYLISPPNKGMSCMFTFINESRMGVAQQALAQIEVSHQNALRYARDRVQFRGTVRRNPEAQADPIIVHPDIRRMLFTQKAFAEGGRALSYFLAKQADLERYSDNADVRENADALLSLLTPVAKGFLSEVAMEATSYGIQIFGGHGYVREWGQEQHFRDARITSIYEGTSGIQGLDLLGRKILASGGQALAPFVMLVSGFCQQNPSGTWTADVQKHLQEWTALTAELGQKAMQNPDEVNAAAYDYLMYSGYTVLAWIWAQADNVANAALQKDPSDQEAEFYHGKIATARFYFERILPRTLALAVSMRSGVENLPEFPPLS
ncbi:MAG: acyl-CoA dehydrogenase C-terminal domain-containing protein [Gammaproteobacteria bacterium]|nr:acyl-CoA dehydrogenase C-terminal domain-containing protein [Gammaproteobacteria bacterium]MDP2346212.1 acyl-CoA dehydrogenase C-terminal domain-containing protein [Gammaproteobacteria bacterium]